MKLKRKKKVSLIYLFMAIIIALTSIQSAALTKNCFAEENKEVSYSDNAVLPSNINTTGYDVIIVADNSGSVWSQQAIRDQALRNIANLAVGSDIRIGGVYFGDYVSKMLSLTPMEKEEDIKTVMDFFNMTEQNENNRGTNIGEALEVASTPFENQNISRKPIIILFSDGINENSNGDENYKNLADNKTLEQVKLLQGKNIPIYCVYLQKDRNDEEYLKNLVNYFDENNSYENERFKKVTDSEIGNLSEEFAHIFYSIQNDMKYREINVDSTGKMTFYVPSLGVKKLQLYLENDNNYTVKLNSPSGNNNGVKEWTNEKSTYISVENPEIGGWTLEVYGDFKENTKGTIAYYTSLYANAEIVNSNDDENIYRNQPQKMQVRFFDQNKNQIEIDQATQVTATISNINDEGENKTESLTFKNDNGIYVSNEFVFEDYGEYKYAIHVTYEDFIDLYYTTDETIKIESRPLVTHDKNGVFLSRGGENGKQFTFKTSDLYSDPDNDSVKIESVAQLNEDNKVTVIEKDGFITVTSEKGGNVKFALNIVDVSGMTAVVNLEGYVIDLNTVNLIGGIIIAIIVIVLAIVIYRITKKRSLEKRLYSGRTQAEDNNKKFETVYKKYEDILKDAVELKEKFQTSIDNLRDLCEEELMEEQKEDFGVNKYINYLYEVEKISKLNNIEEKIENRKSINDINIDDILNTVIPFNISDIQKYVDDVEKYNDDMEDLLLSMRNDIEEYKKSVEALSSEVEIISSTYCDILVMVSTEIKCDLVLEWKNYIGSMECIKNGEYIQGSYSLDNVELLSMDKKFSIKDILKNESTGIFVYGYEDDENGKEGLELRSIKPFRIKNAASGGEGKKVNRAILLKGEEYKLTPEYAGTFLIKVK